jgi:hypothetical protein
VSDVGHPSARNTGAKLSLTCIPSMVKIDHFVSDSARFSGCQLDDEATFNRMHNGRGVLRIRRSMRLWSWCMPTLVWMSTRTGHKPVGYSHNVGFRYHREPEFLIEMNVCSSVGLEIRN